MEMAAAAAQCREIFHSSEGIHAPRGANMPGDDEEVHPIIAAVLGVLRRLRDSGGVPSLQPATAPLEITVGARPYSARGPLPPLLWSSPPLRPHLGRADAGAKADDAPGR